MQAAEGQTHTAAPKRLLPRKRPSGGDGAHAAEPADALVLARSDIKLAAGPVVDDAKTSKGGLAALLVASTPAVARAIAVALSPGGTEHITTSSETASAAVDVAWPFHLPEALAQAACVRLHITSLPEEVASGTPLADNNLQHLVKLAPFCHVVVFCLDRNDECEEMCFEVLRHALKHLASHPQLPVQTPVPATDTLQDLDFASDPRVWRARLWSLAPSQLRPEALAKELRAALRPAEAKRFKARQDITAKVGKWFSDALTAGELGKDGQQVTIVEPCVVPALAFCKTHWDRLQNFSQKVLSTIEVDVYVDGVKRELVRLSWQPPESEPEVEAELRARLATYGTSVVVVGCDRQEQTIEPPSGLNTWALLKSCSSKLGLGPLQCMQIAKSLYHGGFITYPCTTATSYPSSVDLAELVQQHVGHADWGGWCQELLRGDLQKPAAAGHQNDQALDQLPPIMPVRCAERGELQAAGGVDGERLYSLVVRHFLASLSKRKLRYLSHNLQLRLGSELQLSFSGNELLDAGFAEVCPDMAESERSLQEPRLLRGGRLELARRCEVGLELQVASRSVGQAQMPDLFKEAELLEFMERAHLCTADAAAKAVQEIVSSGFVEKLSSDRCMRPSALGSAVVSQLKEANEDLVLPGIFERSEKMMMDLVQTGRIPLRQVMAVALLELRNIFKEIRDRELDRVRNNTKQGRRQAASTAAVFADGARVEYFSNGMSLWLSDRVVCRHRDGSYDLRVKKRADAGNLRAAAEFQVGQEVLYCSAQPGKGDPEPAFVISVSQDDIYELSVPGRSKHVPAARLQNLLRPPLSDSVPLEGHQEASLASSSHSESASADALAAVATVATHVTGLLGDLSEGGFATAVSSPETLQGALADALAAAASEGGTGSWDAWGVEEEGDASALGSPPVTTSGA